MQTEIAIYGQDDEQKGTVSFLGFTPAEDEIWDTEGFTKKQREFLLPICRRSNYFWAERQTVTLSETEEKQFQKIS